MKKVNIIGLLLVTSLIIGVLPGCGKKATSISEIQQQNMPVSMKSEKVSVSSKINDGNVNNEPFTAVIKDTNKPLVIPEYQKDGRCNELWIKHTDGKEELLVSSKAVNGEDGSFDPKKTIAGIHTPEPSLDKKRIYFLSAAWMTSDSIHVVDIETKQEKFLCEGNYLKVIQSGQYSGNLIVSQHRFNSDKNVTKDNFYIIDGEGKEIKDLGEDIRALVVNGLITEEEYKTMTGL